MDDSHSFKNFHLFRLQNLKFQLEDIENLFEAKKNTVFSFEQSRTCPDAACIELGWRPSLLGGAMAVRLEAIAIRLGTIALRGEAIAGRLEAIATRLEAIRGGHCI